MLSLDGALLAVMRKLMMGMVEGESERLQADTSSEVSSLSGSKCMIESDCRR
jgi:hypothetical protein